MDGVDYSAEKDRTRKRELEGMASVLEEMKEHLLLTGSRQPRTYALPSPKYSKPSAFMRAPSSRFLVSTNTGRRMMRRMRSKSRLLNSGQPVLRTRASAPSATP